MTTTTTVAEFEIASPWHLGPAAPNGSVPGTDERTVTKYRIYSADFYGKGEKLYMDIKPFLHYKVNGQVCVSRLPGGSDGNLDRIREVAKRAGVAV
jgi:hypothetical protein